MFNNKIVQLKLQLKRLRGLLAQKKNRVDELGSTLAVPDAFSGEAERNRDGFIQYDPLEEITAVGSELISSITSDQDIPIIEKNIFNFKEKLEEYKTTDPYLLQKQEELLSFLSDEQGTNPDAPSPVTKIVNNMGRFGKIQDDFNYRARQHGKVMIFKKAQ